MGNKNNKNRRKRKQNEKNDGMFGSKKRKHCDAEIDVPSTSTEQTHHESSDQETGFTILELVEPELNQDFEAISKQSITKAPSGPAESTHESSGQLDRESLIIELVEPELEQNFEAISGRRIINMMYFFNKLKDVSNHSALFNCGSQCSNLIGEKRVGLLSKYKFKCAMCGSSFYIDSEDPAHIENVDANVSAVIGLVSAGMAYSQFEEITASMDVPIFSKKLFSKIQDNVFDKWEETAAEEMEAAAEREREAAVAEGRVKNGIALIDVYADGCWSARSYGNNYKALSGAAVIIGRRFGEVLFMAVKNKYCLICARAHKKGLTPKEHLCYKNYTGSSTGMEAEIICEGFKTSIDMYNIIYQRIIADGDSATYSKILSMNPYPQVTVIKIECRNHILRNLCNKLRAVSKEVKYSLNYRKLLTDKRVLTVRKAVVSSIKEHKRLVLESAISIGQGRQNLYADINNSLYHAFGDHRMCKDYFCNKEKDLSNAMEVTNSTFWFRLKVIIGTVASKSQSLLEDVDTNSAERFNSIIAKVVGGKRIFFSARRSYQARCAAAVVLYNNKLPKHRLQKKMLGKSPKSRLKKMEVRRNEKRQWNQRNPYKKNRIHNKSGSKIIQHDYGVNSAAPDLPKDELEKAKEKFLQNLKTLTENKDRIQKETILQRDCCEWVELRKNMVTASNFGQIVKRRIGKSCANQVKNILYKVNLSHVASISHGIDNEKLALEQLAKQENVAILPCGLFVDSEYAFIGATPDGIIGEDTIVEIKCPVTSFKIGLEEAIKLNKIQIYKYNKKTKTTIININSNWFYQVQGQLHVTQRERCLFAIWSDESRIIKTEIIKRDDNFWHDKMEEKLVRFYMECILPEIVDSRHSRGMPIRESNEFEVNNTRDDDANIHPDLQPGQKTARQLDFSEF